MAAKYMARIWARRLEAGTQKWTNCPAQYREQVKDILEQDVADNVISEERCETIIGEEAAETD